MEYISYCGYNCIKCKVYIATEENNFQKQIEIAEEWSKLYKTEFKPEEMICFGCKSDRIFKLCSKCDITVCNKNNNIENCRECDKFMCERIKKFYEWINNNGV